MTNAIDHPSSSDRHAAVHAVPATCGMGAAGGSGQIIGAAAGSVVMVTILR